jgi:hypothetical protein
MLRDFRFHGRVNEICALLGFTQRRMVIFTDVSEKPIGPIVKSQAVQEIFMAHQEGTDILIRNVSNKVQFHAA